MVASKSCDSLSRVAMMASFAALDLSFGGCSGSGHGNASVPTAVATSISQGAFRPVQSLDTNGNDWPEFRRDDQRTGYNPYQTTVTKSNVATLAPKWTQNTHGVFASAVVMNGSDYQADLGGSLFAWNLSSGVKLWQFNTANPPNGDGFESTPAYYNGTLYIGDYGLPQVAGVFRAINPSNGNVIWSYQESANPHASFESSPLVANGLVYEGETTTNESLGTCDPRHQVVAFNLHSATVQSSLNITAPGTGDDVWSSPLLDSSGNVYVATGNACGSGSDRYSDAVIRLKPPSPQLSAAWSFQATSKLPNDDDIGATSVYVSGMVIASSKNGYVYALNPSTGGVIWSTLVGAVIGSPATDGSQLYVPVDNTNPDCQQGQVCGALTALNVSNGSVAWSVPTHEDPYGHANLAAPVISQGIVFAAFDSTIWALDASTGNILWSYPAGGGVVYAGLTLVNGGLLVGDFDRQVYYCFTPNGK